MGKEGNGLQSFKEVLDAGAEEAGFGIIRVGAPNTQGSVTSNRVKIVKIVFVGNKCKQKQRGKLFTGKQNAAQFFQGVAVSIEADCSADVTAIDLADRLKTAGAAHKADKYEFGDETIQSDGGSEKKDGGDKDDDEE